MIIISAVVIMIIWALVLVFGPSARTVWRYRRPLAHALRPKRLFWLTLDRLGHALPLLRFGRLRYAICLRADRYIMEGVPEGEDWVEVLDGRDLRHHFDTLPSVAVVGKPKVIVRSTSGLIDGQPATDVG